MAALRLMLSTPYGEPIRFEDCRWARSPLGLELGDGGSSIAQHPVYTYTLPGILHCYLDREQCPGRRQPGPSRITSLFGAVPEN